MFCSLKGVFDYRSFGSCQKGAHYLALCVTLYNEWRVWESAKIHCLWLQRRMTLEQINPLYWPVFKRKMAPYLPCCSSLEQPCNLFHGSHKRQITHSDFFHPSLWSHSVKCWILHPSIRLEICSLQNK